MFQSRKKTQAQQDRSDKIHAGECLACAQLRDELGLVGEDRKCCGPVEEHHTDGRTKPWAHDVTTSLGSYHHRRVPLPGRTGAEMLAEFGPSLLHGSKIFAARFGNSRDLLSRQDAILRGEA